MFLILRFRSCNKKSLVAFLVVFAFSFAKGVNAQTTNKETTTPLIAAEGEEPVEIPVPFGIVERVPAFRGCEDILENEELKRCTSNRISNYLAQNFKTSLAGKLGIYELIQIYVQFTISETGEVVDVTAKGLHPKLNAEAIRVVSKLPRLQPGIQEGRKVGIMYSLPITFRFTKN